jgi:DNA uptake protein ComE-like DNA-binding protein
VQAQPLRRLLTAVALLISQLAWAATGTGASATSPPQVPAASAASKKAAAIKPVDLNNASKAQLRTLSGIGDAEADLIIASRPYSSKADIVTKGGLPAGLYVAIRRHIYVGKLTKAKAKA